MDRGFSRDMDSNNRRGGETMFDRSLRDNSNMPALGGDSSFSAGVPTQRTAGAGRWGHGTEGASRKPAVGGGAAAVSFSQSQQQNPSDRDEPFNNKSSAFRGTAARDTTPNAAATQQRGGLHGAASSGNIAHQPQQPSAAPVEIEALALFKIMRHCRESWPVPVNGLLVGLDSQKRLEVTDTLEMPSKTTTGYPAPPSSAVTPAAYGQQNAPVATAAASAAALAAANEAKLRLEYETAAYQQRAMEALELANGDCLSVGWYQTLSSSGGIRDSDLFMALAEHQAAIADSLVIGFDPETSCFGVGAFTAFRLSPQAVRMLTSSPPPPPSSDFSKGGVSAASPTTTNTTFRCLRELLLLGRPLLVQVPLLVKNSLLAQIFLSDLLVQNQKQFAVDNCAALDGNTLQPLMTRNLNAGVKILDDVQFEQDLLMKQQKENAKTLHKHREAAERRRIENEQNRLRNEKLLPDLLPPVLSEPPSPLPIMLASAGARLVSKDVAAIAADDICRSFLVNQLVSQTTTEDDDDN